MIALDHVGDDVFPCTAQHPQNVGMCRNRVVIEEFEPPIMFSAYVSCGVHDNGLQYLMRFHCLHCPDETIPAFAVAQSPPAPLLLGRQQPIYSSEFREPIICSETWICSIKRHSPSSAALAHACRHRSPQHRELVSTGGSLPASTVNSMEAPHSYFLTNLFGMANSLTLIISSCMWVTVAYERL
jgi:hypothetical protein